MLRAPHFFARRVPSRFRYSFLLRLPAEAWFSIVFSTLWLIGLAYGLPVNLPHPVAFVLAKKHFFGPIILAIFAQLIFGGIVGQVLLRGRERDGNQMVRLWPLVVLSAFLHFNFKAWMPLITTHLYDPQYQALDVMAAPLLNMVLGIRQFIATHSVTNVDGWYMDLYFLMFFLSLAVHALIDTAQHQRQLVFGMCLIMVIGGVMYSVAPAVGPFLYRDGLNANSQYAQQYMYNLFQEVRATRTYPPEYFVMSLGAMPSLHTAQALFFTLHAARSARWLLILYIPILFWILIEAVASGWHYLIDIPVGAILALACFSFAIRSIPMKLRLGSDNSNHLS